MADRHVVSALRAKRDELDRVISSYEAALAEARRDFVNVNATLELFEQGSPVTAYSSRLSVARMFKRGELFELCKIALSGSPECLDTRELALYVIHAKGMDEKDTVLRKAIGFRIVQAMLRQKSRGHVAAVGKRRGVRIWMVDR